MIRAVCPNLGITWTSYRHITMKESHLKKILPNIALGSPKLLYAAPRWLRSAQKGLLSLMEYLNARHSEVPQRTRGDWEIGALRPKRRYRSVKGRTLRYYFIVCLTGNLRAHFLRFKKYFSSELKSSSVNSWSWHHRAVYRYARKGFRHPPRCDYFS